MIRPGTLCLLVAPHSLAGKTCTVNRLLPWGVTLLENDLTISVIGPGREIYDIDVPGQPVTGGFVGWAAARNELVPLNDPDSAQDRDTPVERIAGRPAFECWVIG